MQKTSSWAIGAWRHGVNCFFSVIVTLFNRNYQPESDVQSDFQKLKPTVKQEMIRLFNEL